MPEQPRDFARPRAKLAELICRRLQQPVALFLSLSVSIKKASLAGTYSYSVLTSSCL